MNSRVRLFIGASSCVAIALALTAVLWPLPATILHPRVVAPIRILDRNGNLLYEARNSSEGSHATLSLHDTPDAFVRSLIATEDRTFYEHPGVSLRGIVRAAWQNITAGHIVSGGSTITQQLVRMRLPAGTRGYLRKIEEIVYAVKLERTLSKDQILEAYINEAYFGHQAYGLRSAAMTFFGKNPSELSVAECTFLVGLLQSPSAYDPFQNIQPAIDRQQRVLQALRDSASFSADIIAQAAKEPLTLASGKVPVNAAHFVFWLLQQRGSQLQGLPEVRTTIDLPLQQSAERAVALQLQALKEQHVTDAAVVILDAVTGDLLAMVGSADYFDASIHGSVNVALSPRQPGSTMKPFTYALALHAGDTAATTVADVQTQFLTQEGTPYVPRNYDYTFHGLVRYREALANSYNAAAVRVLQKVGPAALLSFLKDAGISTLTEAPEHYGLALTLGDAEVSLLELTRAYALFPRAGKPLGIRTLLTDPIVPGTRILDEKTAWLVSDILSDNNARTPEFGTNGPLTFSYPVAAKTGTTRNARDNWTVGYTPNSVVGVWVGNADNSPMKDTSGVTGAGPIFHAVMDAVSRSTSHGSFQRPPGFVQRSICRLSGKLPTALCTDVMSEWFVEGTEPTKPDDLYRSIAIDTRTGLLASDACPTAYVIHKTYAILPPELASWAQDYHWPLPPRQASPLCTAQPHSNSGTWLTITSPPIGAEILLDPLIPRNRQQILLRAVASPNIEHISWSMNGKTIGQASAPDFALSWPPEPGQWTCTATAGNQHQSVTFRVTNDQPEERN